jgi:hypothetical protein
MTSRRAGVESVWVVGEFYDGALFWHHARAVEHAEALVDERNEDDDTPNMVQVEPDWGTYAWTDRYEVNTIRVYAQKVGSPAVKISQACGSCGRNVESYLNGEKLERCVWAVAGEKGVAVTVDAYGEHTMLLGDVEIRPLTDPSQSETVDP